MEPRCSLAEMEQKRAENEVSRCRIILSQMVACSALNLLLIDLGMSVSFVTTVLPVLLNAKEGLSIDQYQASWFGSILFLCQPLGSVFSGPILDYFGRKKAILLVSIPHVVAWILMHLSWNVPCLFFANALLGFGTGLMEAPSVTYVGEISEPSLRGILTTLTSSFTSVGMLAAYFLGSRLSYRTAALVCLAVPCLTMLLTLLIPETPIWLISKDRKGEAMKSLRRLRGWCESKHVNDEFEDLVIQSEKLQQCAICVGKDKHRRQPECTHSKLCFLKRALLTFRYVMLTKETLRPFQLVMAYFVINSVCGMAPIRANMMNVFEAFGMDAEPKNIITTVGVLSIVTQLISAALIRQVGKRLLILSTTSATVVGFVALAVYAWAYLPAEVFSYNPETFPKEKSLIPLILFYLMYFTCHLGIPWVLLSEVFSFRSRGTATSLAAACHYFIIFVISKTNLEIEGALGLHGSFGFYATFGVLGFVYLYFYLPETEGKSLREIEELYAGKRRTFENEMFLRKKKDGKEIEDVATVVVS